MHTAPWHTIQNIQTQLSTSISSKAVCTVTGTKKLKYMFMRKETCMIERENWCEGSRLDQTNVLLLPFCFHTYGQLTYMNILQTAKQIYK